MKISTLSIIYPINIAKSKGVKFFNALNYNNFSSETKYKNYWSAYKERWKGKKRNPTRTNCKLKESLKKQKEKRKSNHLYNPWLIELPGMETYSKSTKKCTKRKIIKITAKLSEQIRKLKREQVKRQKNNQNASTTNNVTCVTHKYSCSLKVKFQPSQSNNQKTLQPFMDLYLRESNLSKN